jgi:hypothetical protein
MNMKEIPRDSRTKNEIFQTDYQKFKDKMTWKLYWCKQWMDCIDFYKEMGFQLLATGWQSKNPLKGVHYEVRDLSYPNALGLGFESRLNIGVKLMQSGLIVADLDEEHIPIAYDKLEPYFFRTLSVKSPSGFHVYFRCDHSFNENLLKRMDDAFGVRLFFRGRLANHYVLVPLSCVENKVYEFINKTPNLMPFSELVKEVLANGRN